MSQHWHGKEANQDRLNREAAAWEASHVTIPRAQHEALTAKAKAWDLVNELRKSEGHAVTLMCDNPDFNGQPNCAIEACGEHTGWQAKRFTGDTVIEALEKAVAAAALTPVPPSNDKGSTDD